MTRIHALTAAALLAAAAIAPAAHAAPAAPVATSGYEPTKIIVRHDDLNLASRSDQARLAQRVRTAVNRACNVGHSRTTVDQRNASKCRAQAQRRADFQVAQLMQSRSGTMALRITR